MMAASARRLDVLAIFLVVSLLAGQEVGADDLWTAGAARSDITPQVPMWMAGYASRNKPSEGTLTPLWAKALVLEDVRGKRAVLITLDLIGVDRELSSAICQRLKEKYGLERHQIAICSSHTHTGPALRRNLAPLHYLLVDHEQRRRIDEYTTHLVTQIAEVVGAAIQGKAPCRLSWGLGHTSLAVNRRENPAEDVGRRRADGELKGPIDHSVPVLAVRDQGGKLNTVVFGYACHATTLSSYQWSGDYPGFAQLELEENHPGSLAMFWAGCGADQNPLPRRTEQLAQHYGRQLASAVDTVLLTSEMRPIKSDLHTSYREVELPFAELPTRQQIEQDAQSTNRYVAARAKLFLRRLDEGHQLPTTYPYPVGVWKLGNRLRWIALGGEVVVDYAIRLKTELSDKPTWVAGYTNDVMAYIPSRRVLLEGGYEGGGAMVYYGLPSAWAPTVEKIIVDEVHDQVNFAK